MAGIQSQSHGFFVPAEMSRGTFYMPTTDTTQDMGDPCLLSQRGCRFNTAAPFIPMGNSYVGNSLTLISVYELQADHADYSIDQSKQDQVHPSFGHI